MPVSLRSPRVPYTTLVTAALLGWAAGPLQAQERVAFGRPIPISCPPAPCLTGEGTPVTPPPGEPTIPPSTFLTPDERGPGESQFAFLPPMLGDFLAPSGGIRTVMFGPNCSTPTAHTFRVPSASHGYKIADDESPFPRDRVFVAYNYYNNVNDHFNSVVQSGVGQIDVHREIFGFEKTFLNGNASFGMRLPLNTLDASSGSVPGLGGTFTDLGDLTLVFKGVLLQNRSTGNILSGGVCVTVPSGPSNFAGTPTQGTSVVCMQPPPPPPPPPPPNFLAALATQPGGVNSQITTVSPHDTLIQPWLGGALFFGDAFVHGFTAIDIATDSNDVTLMYNDLGVGYFLYRSGSSDRRLTAVIPTVEVHVNTPLSHRGTFNGPAGTPDWVDLTGGCTFQFNHRSTLGVGVSAPITGARPYDMEAIVELNFRF